MEVKNISDIINFNLLSPFTMHKVVEGLRLLNELEYLSGSNVKEYNYAGMTIKASALKKGRELLSVLLFFSGKS